MRIICLIAAIALASCAPENTASAPAQAAASGAPDPAHVLPRAQVRVREMLQNPEGLTFTDTEVYHAGGPLWIVCGRYNRDDAAYRYVYVDGMAAYLEPRDSAARLDRAQADYCPPVSPRISSLPPGEKSCVH